MAMRTSAISPRTSVMAAHQTSGGRDLGFVGVLQLAPLVCVPTLEMLGRGSFGFPVLTEKKLGLK